MSENSTHPMDNIKIRKLHFDVESIKDDYIWSKSHPEFAIYINAIGLHVPYFERYLIATMKKALGKIDNEKLREDVVAIIGQEAHHAKNFIDFNKCLHDHYPRSADYEKHNKDYFLRHAKSDSFDRMVGFTSGYETFTFISGMIVLDHYEKWLHDSNPAIRALWVWHQIEEVEHGAVAFDVYQYFQGQHEWRRKWYVFASMMHIFWETMRPYLHMCKTEGYFQSLKGTWKALKFMGWMGIKTTLLSLPVFRKGYSPRQHPAVTQKQNPVSFAWRNYEDKNGDVLAIDKKKMAEILTYELGEQSS